MSLEIPDDLLCAYVDGQLNETERARIEQAIARDARLAQRVAQQRALRGRLRNVFDGALRQPLAQRRVNAARLESSSGPAQVIDLARVRAARARRTERRRIPLPRRAVMVIAASLLVGAGAGLMLEHLIVKAGPTEYRDGALLAAGALNRALNEQLATAAPGAGAVRIGMSFHAKSGGYCRTFVLDNSRTLTGLACREQDRWHILALLGADAPAILPQAVNERISGEPLDANAEARARRSGWH
jgi:hypothetical protein